MIYLLDNFDEAVKLGNTGRQIAEEKYDSVKVNKSVFEIMNIPYKEEITV